MASIARRRPPSMQGTHYRPGAVETGTIAFIFHRITGVFLTIYLMTHLVVIGQSVRSKAAFDAALHFVGQPVFVFLDAGLAGIVTYHALNGLRIVGFDLGWGIRQQKVLFWIAVILAIAVFLVSIIAAHELL